KLEKIVVLDKEVTGAKLARAVWSDMTNDQTIAGGELAALSSTNGRDFGVESKIDLFRNARSATERATIGADLLGDVADASTLSLDPAMDTYHAQDIFVRRLADVELALVQLHDSLNLPSLGDAELAMEYAGLRAATENLRKSLRVSENDLSGEAKRALGGASAQ